MELTTILYVILGLILTIVGGWEIIARFVMKLNSSDSDLQVSEFQNSNKVKPLLGLKDRLTTYTAIAGLLIFSILFDVFWRDTLGFPFGLLTEISIFLILSIGLILLAARLKKKINSVRFFIAQEIVFLTLFIIIASFLSLLVWSVFRFTEPPELFKFKTGDWVVASLAVSDGVVYVGSKDNHLYAINANTGQEIWRFKTDADVVSCPAVSDGVVYVGSNDRHLYAINANTGQEIWRFKTGDGVSLSPALFDGVVFVGSVSDGVVFVGARDNHLYAVNTNTGQEIWRFQTDSWIRSSPAVSDGVVYVGSDDNHLYALNTNTGQEIWRFKTGGDVWSSPAVSDGVVYFGSNDGYLRALE